MYYHWLYITHPMVKSTTMTTTRETLTTLMSLVDNHKEDFKEGEYLAICNLMRDLHREATQPQPQPQPQAPTPPPVDMAALERRFDETARVNRLRFLFRRLESLRTSTNRVCLTHKIQVLASLDPELIPMVERGARTQSQWVSELERAYITRHPTTTLTELRGRYRLHVTDVTTRMINDVRLEIGQVRATMYAARTARETEEVNGWPRDSIEVWMDPVTSLDHHLVPP